MIAAEVGLSWMVGDPFELYAPYRSEKLHIMAADRESCSAAFGSSHVHNGFDPRAFDREVSAPGAPVHSLNLAIEGGSQGEQFLMAQRFLATRQPTSTAARCLVILEANAGANFPENVLVHPRSINTYDAKVAAISADFASPELGFAKSLGRLAATGIGTSLHYLSTGMLASRLFPHELDADLLRRQTKFDRRGLLSETTTDGRQADIMKLVRDKPPSPAHTKGLLTKGQSTLVGSLREGAHLPKIEFVLLVTPKLSDLSVTADYPACVRIGEQAVRVIDPAQPEKHPDLYLPQYWYDDAHLNEPGAAVFSALIADELREPLAANSCARM
jgi:hypothetical protein